MFQGNRTELTYTEKAVIVGSAEAGKTCLMNSIADSDGYRHSDRYIATIGRG